MIAVPSLKGLVWRRVLVNFRVDPEIARRHLPARFQPKLVAGWAMAGICLIRLEQLRPRGLPAALGVASESAAHRIAVTWRGDDGEPHEGVYIPRRDTGACLNAVAGGRIFPGEHHYARFRVRDAAAALDLKMETDSGAADVWLRARPSTGLPSTSKFASLQAASDFFAAGSIGYSATRDGARLDGLRLHTDAWRVETLDVDWVTSAYYADRVQFPAGSVEYDSTLIMRNLPHVWHAAPAIRSQPGTCGA